LFFVIWDFNTQFITFEKKYNMDLSQNDWAAQLENDTNAVILDVRTEDEWSEGIIPGALMNDIYKGQAFIYKLDELDKNKNYYVYCKAGGRSAQACNIMNQMGFKNTYNLVGGFMNWQGEVSHPE
jgi:rhodanese-related sulfurtransferase